MNDVMIIGVGGAGCNMAEAFMRKAKTSELKNARYVFASMDPEALDKLQIDANKTCIH